MKIFQSIQVSNAGLSCQQCIHFQNDPALIEDVFGGLRSLSSGFASVRDRDGICSYHRIYLSGRDSCGDLVVREGVDEDFTAADGSTVSYVVVVKVLSNKKAITSFVFAAASNPGLASDLTGIIKGDTILVYGDSTVKPGGLIPTITYTGAKIDPGTGVKQDFSHPVYYTVTAEDGSYATYTVLFSFNRVLYVGSDDGNLYALDANNGSIQWKAFTSAGDYSSAPVVGGGLVFASDGEGYLKAFDASSGNERWSIRVGMKFTASLAPTYANGMLYTGAVDGSVNAIDALSGQIRWSFLTKGQVLSGPCVVDVGGNVRHPTGSGDQE